MDHSDKWLVTSLLAPTKGPGFYPTIHMWDLEEGGSPSGTYWAGDWTDGQRYIALFIDERYETEDEAEKRAYQFDPNM